MEQKQSIKSKKTILLASICIAGLFAAIWLFASSMSQLVITQSEVDQANHEVDKSQTEYDKALKACLEVAYTECKDTSMKVCMKHEASFKQCEKEWWEDYDRVTGA